MPDINVIFKKLFEDKGAPYIAMKLGYSNTQSIERWFKDRIPSSRFEVVIELLTTEGLLQ